ncbi:LOG family protein [Mariprofundus erugo]|uniref:AMP nucleosidase n=1 Tax=Mariprofundus erugo TaxID=2528639 RepID=A0A5R9GT75_9PROT|nr:nucleotide 5'-monophosphate nucleosidase PpnN [Mariprofundus erugo]TLS67633.1 LOG family protein [Mariprofundus erugo]TLS73840.1 LOG family protein [Mariprofundus erugo]
MSYEVMNAMIEPLDRLEVLSRLEVEQLLNNSSGGLHHLFRSCALAVLNCDGELDDGRLLLERYSDFDIRVHQVARGIRLELLNAPARAFVDGKMIRGIHEHLFSVLRDIVFVHDEITNNANIDLSASAGITNAVFYILRNAGVFRSMRASGLVVCWGGHAISRNEYDYSKLVGYELGLRGLDVCTGCGPGAMKGPMKGATIGHAKQRIDNGLYLGVTEPGIIAAESPNPIVNNLTIFPDIEKRLEAFVRTGHGVVVFAGGVGTAEEILYLLGVLLHPENRGIPFPLIFTGPESARAYFARIDDFIVQTLGEEARQCYQVIIDDPVAVARAMHSGVEQVREYRRQMGDAWYFNWSLTIDPVFQHPFAPTHENIRGLALHRQQPPALLAANLRRVFSALVAGNVKDEGIRAVEQFGDFEIHGEREIMAPVDALLSAFVAQGRMKVTAENYRPCYKISDF